MGVRVNCEARLGPRHETLNARLGSWDILVAVGGQRGCWSKGTIGSELEFTEIHQPSECGWVGAGRVQRLGDQAEGYGSS